jgi:VIT1/CCC1 family predicted Fe2+/Mn2+ transporter
MTFASWLRLPSTRLDLVGGIVDGILTALTLTANKLLSGPENSVDARLAFKVSCAAGLSTLFVFFLAHYAQLRSELIRAERKLNVLRHGRLASGHLGRQVLYESLASAVLAAFCSLAGALLPMLAALFMPGPRWLGSAAIVVLLGILGAALARSFYGSPLAWGGSLMLAGIVMTILGFELAIAA